MRIAVSALPSSSSGAGPAAETPACPDGVPTPRAENPRACAGSPGPRPARLRKRQKPPCPGQPWRHSGQRRRLRWSCPSQAAGALRGATAYALSDLRPLARRAFSTGGRLWSPCARESRGGGREPDSTAGRCVSTSCNSGSGHVRVWAFGPRKARRSIRGPLHSRPLDPEFNRIGRISATGMA